MPNSITLICIGINNIKMLIFFYSVDAFLNGFYERMILSANLWLTISLMLISFALGNEDAKRLYDDLMIRYNRLSRPSSNPHIPITIKLKLRLSQIIDVVTYNFYIYFSTLK